VERYIHGWWAESRAGVWRVGVWWGKVCHMPVTFLPPVGGDQRSAVVVCKVQVVVVISQTGVPAHKQTKHSR